MLAHQLDHGYRSQDVITVENVTFKNLLLSDNVYNGLVKHGFKKPSPIQLKAIPLGRCGFDLIVKSKSGTGKTLVFSIIALESLKPKLNNLEVLILSPTREIAIQSQDVIRQIGCFFEDLQVESFIGGLSVVQDKEKCKSCHIAVGTPGRMKHLINEDVLKVNAVKLFVLDEADKLMESSFRNDINEIYNKLPSKKQLITTSATYPNNLEAFLSNYMLSPTHITAEVDSPLLLGLKQFVVVTKYHSNIVQHMKIKTEELVNIFSNISFTQCIIFTNYQTRAESLSNILNQKGWAATYISAAQSQQQRLAAVNNLKSFKCRIMLSTDLTARGIDAANVDLVINYDIPGEASTYLHRMGRAGRYGSHGICVNLAAFGAELEQLQEILGYIGGEGLTIPKLPPFIGSIPVLLELEIPLEDHISSKISTNMNNPDPIKYKMFETKPDNPSSSNKKALKAKKNESTTTEFDPNNSDYMLKQISEQVSETDELSESSSKEIINSEIIDILNSAKSEVDEVSKQINEMDNESILNSLLNQSFKLESEKCDLGCKEIDTKAIFNLLNESCPKSASSNSKGCIRTATESEDLEKENIFVKNTALLNVSKILSNSNAEEDISIKKHLNVLKSRDKDEISKLSMKSVPDILKMLEQQDIEIETAVEMDKKYTNSNKISEDIRSSSSTIIENKSFTSKDIFEFGYQHIVNSDNDSWKGALQDLLQSETKQNSEEMCYHDEDTVNMHEEIGSGYCGDRNKNDDEEIEVKKWELEDINMVSSKASVESNIDSGETTDDVNVEIMKWVPVKTKNNSKKATFRNDNYSKNWVGTDETRYGTQQTLMSEVEENSEIMNHVDSYLEECSNSLWQNGLTFNSVDAFDEWFHYEWEAQLYSVRNYVQQNIYVNEMAKYQNSRQNS